MGRRALIATLVIAGCGSGGSPSPGAALPDASPSARTVITPEPGPDARPRDLTPCAIENPDSVDEALDLAATKLDEGNADGALACAELAARLWPHSVEAHHDRGDALAALERWEDAKLAFTHALAIDPDDPRTLSGAAELYINRLPPDREYTEIGLTYAKRGSLLVGGRRIDRQLQAMLALLEAQALDDLGRTAEALARVDAALSSDGTLEEARDERALILFHLCRFDKARKAFEEILVTRPEDAYALYYLGLLLERDGDVVGAEARLARAAAIAPDKYPLGVMLAPAEFQVVVDRAVAALDPGTRKLLDGVRLEIADLPSLADLTAVKPPFSPTILGLFRGTPLGEPSVEPRSIVFYRKNLGRAVTNQTELEDQVRVTLWHELGHLLGQDEEELRARGLE